MKIRLAAEEDIPVIMSLIREVVPEMIRSGNFQWDDNYPNEAVLKEDVRLHQLWVAEVSTGIIAGVAAITGEQEPEYSNVGWNMHEEAIVIHRLAVSPRYRGKGIAQALLTLAEEVAIGRGISVLRVDTNSANEATQNLFPKLGYVYAGDIQLAFRPELLFYCYEKRL